MKLSKKAQAKMNEIVARFQTGDLSPIVKVAKTRLDGEAPSQNWSFSNRVLALALTEDFDCRTYNQWKKAGRQVRKGETAGFIFTPRTIKETDDNGKETYRLIGFGTRPVFGYSQTDPIGEGEAEPVVNYEPKELPPLTDVADALGIEYKWTVTDPGAMGWCTADGKKIAVGTDDPKTWFHELGHAIHAQFEKLEGGQTEYQETVAEFTATILMELYDLGDRTGNAWEYISQYADDPVLAVTRALDTVGKVIGKITELAEKQTT